MRQQVRNKIYNRLKTWAAGHVSNEATVT